MILVLLNVPSPKNYCFRISLIIPLESKCSFEYIDMITFSPITATDNSERYLWNF